MISGVATGLPPAGTPEEPLASLQQPPMAPTSSPVPLSALPTQDWSSLGRLLERDGVVFIKRAFSPLALSKLESAIEWSFANPSETARRFYPDDPAKFFEDRGSNHAGVAKEVGLDGMLRRIWGGLAKQREWTEGASIGSCEDYWKD